MATSKKILLTGGADATWQDCNRRALFGNSDIFVKGRVDYVSVVCEFTLINAG